LPEANHSLERCSRNGATSPAVADVMSISILSECEGNIKRRTDTKRNVVAHGHIYGD